VSIAEWKKFPPFTELYIVVGERNKKHKRTRFSKCKWYSLLEDVKCCGKKDRAAHRMGDEETRLRGWGGLPR
jgi:hypothetical protein